MLVELLRALSFKSHTYLGETIYVKDDKWGEYGPIDKIGLEVVNSHADLLR